MNAGPRPGGGADSPRAGRTGGDGGSSRGGFGDRQVLFLLGVIFLSAAAVFSFFLVLEHMSGLSLPGCGEGGGCEKAANSFWGSLRVGGLKWPTANLGLAYFLAMLFLWLRLRGMLPPLLRLVARFGAFVSLGFMILIFGKSMLCPYCIAAHLSNFVFCVAMERSWRLASAPSGVSVSGPEAVSERDAGGSHDRAGVPLAGVPLQPAGGAIVFAGAFLVLTAVLGVWEWSGRATVTRKAEAERARAAREMIGQAAGDRDASLPAESQAPAQTPAPGSSAASSPVPNPAAGDSGAITSRQARTKTAPTSPSTRVTEAASLSTDTATSPSGKLFTGRYRFGPEAAAIRIVIFAGYQCPDCAMIEQQLVPLMETRKDISVSMKHFPFCSDCNPFVSRSPQKNGCWAARAAEAAGILWGTDGFWKMHKFLFTRHGSFTSIAELQPGFTDPAYSVDDFTRLVMSEETLRRVRSDCAEGDSLGLYFTPMIFINGVELKGWSAPGALTRTVAEIAASNPPARTAAADHPPVAMTKYIEDWRAEPVRSFLPEKHTWRSGPENAAVRIVLWGDYQESGTVEADSILQAYVASHPEAGFVFRHYPFNKECAPKVPDNKFPNACRAAWAAEAAGLLGGNDAFWRMHAWLMKNRGDFTDEKLSAAASSLGLDGAALLTAMNGEAAKAMVRGDVTAADGLPVLRLGVPAGLYSIPTVFINGKYVQRTHRGDRSSLPDLLEAAAKGKSSGGEGSGRGDKEAGPRRGIRPR